MTAFLHLRCIQRAEARTPSLKNVQKSGVMQGKMLLKSVKVSICGDDKEIEMESEMKTAWFGIIIGLGLHLIYGTRGVPQSMNELLGRSGGTIILLAACALYAQNKGRSRNWGLLALMSFLGVIILLCLPRKNA